MAYNWNALTVNPNDPATGGSGLGWGGASVNYNNRKGLPPPVTPEQIAAAGGMRGAAHNWLQQAGPTWSANNGYVPGAHGGTPMSFYGTNAYKGPGPDGGGPASVDPTGGGKVSLASLAKGGGALVTPPAAPYTGPAPTRTMNPNVAPLDPGMGAGEWSPGAGAGGAFSSSGTASGGGNGGRITGGLTDMSGNIFNLTPGAPGQLGSDHYTGTPQGTPINPGGGGGAPGGGTPAPGASVGYGINVNDYLDPSMQFQMQQGLDALKNTAAARGSLDSGQTLKDILAYSQGLAGTDYNNAFNRATNVRNFNYGVDTGDRDFAYRTASDDWNRTYQPLRDLATMGLSGTQGAAGSDNTLSALIAGLMQNAGQIQGAGTIGQGNNVNNTISSILSQLLGGGYNQA